MKAQRRLAASRAEWEGALGHLPAPHLLQSWDWGEVKQTTGWRPQRHLWIDGGGEPIAAAQVLERSAGRSGFTAKVLYCPKGPLLDWTNAALRQQILSDMASMAVERRALQIKVDPDVPIGFGVPGEDDERPAPVGPAVQKDMASTGWAPSPEHIQFRNTMILDLTPDSDDIMAAMKQKTRYNVRLAGRRGVEIRRGGMDDLDLLYRMYAETSVRDGFVIRSPEYYHRVWGHFVDAGSARPLLAEVEGEPIAAVIPFQYGERAWYLYGMSIDRHRDKMPNYLLQWEAIEWAKERGCASYDLWGAPEVFDRSDPMWGVYRFKSGFHAQVVRTIGPWDFAPTGWRYSAYHRLLPLALRLLRMIGRRQTRSDLE